MFIVLVLLLFVFLIVKVVHHLSILTVIIVKMFLWSVVRNSINDLVNHFFVICSLEFSYSTGSGPYTTLNTCDSGKFILNDFSA